MKRMSQCERQFNQLTSVEPHTLFRQFLSISAPVHSLQNDKKLESDA